MGHSGNSRDRESIGRSSTTVQEHYRTSDSARVTPCKVYRPRKLVVSHFEMRFLYFAGRFGFGARASISPTIHSQSRTVVSSPAAIAGVTRSEP